MVFASTIQSDGQVVSVVYSDGREEVVDGPTEGLSATRVDGTDHPKEPTSASTKNSTIQPLYDFAVGFMYVLTLVDMMVRTDRQADIHTDRHGRACARVRAHTPTHTPTHTRTHTHTHTHTQCFAWHTCLCALR